ncbi:MAG TPA: penicillin-binding protein activator [Cellvibrionaceae bacterium]
MSVFSRWVVISLVPLLFIGCASTPQQPDKTINQTQSLQQQIQKWLQQAEKVQGPERNALLLQAADGYVKLHNLEQAQGIIDAVPATELGGESYVKRALIYSLIADRRGNYLAAKEAITGRNVLAQLNSLSGDTAVAARKQRAKLFNESGDYTKAAKERLMLVGLLAGKPQEDQTANNTALWQLLLELPEAQLFTSAAQAKAADAKAWYELAHLYKGQQYSAQSQLQALNSWMKRYPDHPASKQLPKELQDLKQQLAELPKQIALLMPQSGKLEAPASAIVDGLMAAYYEQQKNGALVPILRFYNTEGQQTLALYQKAVQEGADIVIGPLEKERVSELSQQPQLPVPVLALNTLETAGNAQLYQIGLSVEDEAKQIAAQALREGLRRAVVILPANALGDRNLATFAQTFRQQGGTLYEYRYGANTDFGELTRRALQIDQSENRVKAIAQIIGPVEAQPTARTDIDMIFAVVQPEQARQLKPNLNFYYAANVPLYATSSVFSGEQTAQNTDLNQTRFLTLPWYFNRTDEKTALEAASDKNPNFARLYALGVDVFNLAPRLKHGQKNNFPAYYGSTGTLTLNKNNQFERQQTWATFDASGNVQLLGNDTGGDLRNDTSQN